MNKNQNKSRLFFLFAAVFLFGALPLIALADETPPAKKPVISEVGFITGYGQAGIAEGRYETIFTILRIGIDAERFFPSLSQHKGKLSFIVEPQYNPVLEPERTSEFGVGIGLQYAYPLAERLTPYILGVVGPHYINIDTRTQAHGFIFSNAVGVGAYLHLTKEAAVNIGYRLRHMSNAYTHDPNHGIDSHFAVFGLSYFF